MTDEIRARYQQPMWADARDALLNRLRGRMNLIQSAAERIEVTLAALNELYRHATADDALAHLDTEPRRREFAEAFLSYDLVEEFLEDPSVEDVMINGLDLIHIHQTDRGLVRTDKRFASSQELDLFVKKLIIFGGRSTVETINDLELAGIRGRVNVVLSPLGPQITITRAKEQPLSILQLIAGGLLSEELAAQLWMYIEGLGIRPANLLIGGGPGSGKTTLLNALLSFIPRDERLVIIEDTLELNTQFLGNCSRLESSREVTMAALVKNSLRMRPDRILVGEVRGEEARDLMTAVNIGKYCMGTLHASNARETVIRLQNEPMNVPEILVNLVDVLIVLKRIKHDHGIRRIVNDVVETAGLEQHVVLLSTVWAYDYERKETREMSPSIVCRDRLATSAGVNPLHVMREIARRAWVLKLMRERPELLEIGETTRFCQTYVASPAEAVQELGLTLEQLDRSLGIGR